MCRSPPAADSAATRPVVLCRLMTVQPRRRSAAKSRMQGKRKRSPGEAESPVTGLTKALKGNSGNGRPAYPRLARVWAVRCPVSHRPSHCHSREELVTRDLTIVVPAISANDTLTLGSCIGIDRTTSRRIDQITSRPATTARGGRRMIAESGAPAGRAMRR
jgi:hypothetical protein